ncbi:winged helix-turn-helix domain-containing protein [Pyrococcus kukulkanii]|uniref:winged helix-turn-helix domain-containing protein n=1 Tax=Pyrococcus kukulkanii TaxID=1609559 RepID=UPI003565D659
MYKLISTKERVEILRYILERDTIRVEETAKKLGVSKGLVSKLLHMLEKEGIVKKEGVFQSNPEPKNKGTQEISKLLNLIPKTFATKRRVDRGFRHIRKFLKGRE